MSIVSKLASLRAYLDSTRALRNTLTLKLFVNDYTPLVTSEAIDFVEATFDGYAPQATTLWSLAFINASNQAESTEAVRVFIRATTGVAETVYGYYLVDGAGDLVFAERNPAGGTPIATAGDTYAVLPRMVCENIP